MKRNRIQQVKRKLSKALISTMLVSSFFSLAQVYANEAYIASSAAQEVYADSDKSYMADSQEVNFRINLNGSQITLSEPVRLVEGTSFLPLRQTAKAVGVSENSIGWCSEFKTACVVKNDRKVEVVRGSNSVVLNESLSDQVLAQKMFITTSGVSYLPLRGISEGLDIAIKWDSENKIIYIDTNKTYAESDSIVIPTNPTSLPKSSKERMENSLKRLFPDMTEEQFNETMGKISLPPDGDGTRRATQEQQAYYEAKKSEAIEREMSGEFSEPNFKGSFRGQLEGIYCWDGESWTRDVELWAGMNGLAQYNPRATVY